MIYVAIVEYYDTLTDSVKLAYYATEGFASKPTDTPADTTIENRVVTPALLRRDIFDIGTTGGASRVGFGDLELNNEDGALDFFATAAIDGRDLTVLYADDASAALPSGYDVLFTGTMDQASIGARVKIRLRDRQVYALLPLQPNRYGGTNTGGNGVDGNPDLAGKVKPVAIGGCFNVTPVCVNPERLIFQVNDGTIKDLAAVYDSGALLSRYVGSNYADQTDMEANQPGEGEYRIWKAGGMFRLGSAPIGELTCDVITGLSPADRTAGAIYRHVLLAAGISSGNISAADITALDSANRATLGLYYRDEVTNQQVLDDIARSVGAWWGTDTAGTWRIQRLEAPSGSPVLTLLDGDVRALERVPLADHGLPTYRVTGRGVQNYTVQTNGLVGIVGAPRRARLALPFQDAAATDLTVKTAYLLSPELLVETKLSCLAAVQAESARLLALEKVKRDRYEAVIDASRATLQAIDLGVVVQLKVSRNGLDAGALFRVIGYQLDPTQGSASLTLWG